MKILESIRLRHRANKYRKRDDPGGIAYLLSHIQEGQIVFDIGAHKAGYLYYIRKLSGPSGKIFAFEPQQQLYEYIRKIKDLFHWNNVTIEHLALSDEETTATLYIPSNKVSNGSSPGATLVKQEHRTDMEQTESVRTGTLDQYCESRQLKPAFLKIDVEGNELKIFKGGIRTIKKYQPKILVEIEARHVGIDQAIATFDFLKNLGYTGYFIHGLLLRPLNEFSFEKFQNGKDAANYCNNFVFEPGK